MKVYIASNFADKDRVKARGEELAAIGIECTSRWALETAPHNCTITDVTSDYLRETAVFDLQDILVADKVVLTVPTPKELMNMTPHQMSRGGRHFESGLMYGLIWAQVMRTSLAQYEADSIAAQGCKSELIVLGEKENVFHFLDGIGPAANYPTVVAIPTWEEVKNYLASQLTK